MDRKQQSADNVNWVSFVDEILPLRHRHVRHSRPRCGAVTVCGCTKVLDSGGTIRLDTLPILLSQTDVRTRPLARVTVRARACAYR